MFQDLCRWGKVITFGAIASGTLMNIFVSLASACFVVSTIGTIVALAIAYSVGEPNDKIKDVKTIFVAVHLIAAMVFFTLAVALSGAPVLMIMALVMMTGIVTYVIARFAQNHDPRCSITLLFIILLPFGFLVATALTTMSPRKKGE